MAKKKPVEVNASVGSVSCMVFTTARDGFKCPLCQMHVPANVRHECEVDGGVRVVRNRRAAATEAIAEATEGLRR